MHRSCLALLAIGIAAAEFLGDVRRARDAQDKSALEAAAAQAAAVAGEESSNPQAHYETALVYSYLAEVETETRDTSAARKAAEAGIAAAEKAVAARPNSAEYHRILGTLCGQMVPGNSLGAALKYGRRAQEELDRAVALDPKSSDVYLSRGIGKYYLPAMFGGGVEAALEDLRKAIELNPKNDQAYLWQGIALRKAKRNGEARAALGQALKLNPRRAWAKQQLEKTPEQ